MKIQCINVLNFLRINVNKIFKFICMCVSLCQGVHMSVGACGGQERVLDSLELEWQAVVSHPIWVL